MVTYEPLKEVMELREQLASPRRRLGFFLGAGTSMAVGVDGIAQLTIKVGNTIPNPLQPLYADILKQLGTGATVEHVLNRVRLYRELLSGSSDRCIDGLTGTTAKQLDIAICATIARLVNVNIPGGPAPQRTLAQWCRLTQRDHPVELFTTNYDLLFDRAMEDLGIPFFDGFVGSVAPFFAPESVEADATAPYLDVCPPRAWIRLWKVHGSIGWKLVGDGVTSRKRIVRTYSSEASGDEELLIYPSRDKYDESRKLPFITYLDRLRRFMVAGEVILVVSGYSFGDEHLNDILYQGLRANNRLSVMALSFGPLTEALAKAGSDHRNLTILASDKACIGGVVGSWDKEHLADIPKDWPIWDETKDRFALGDFSWFARFLEIVMGFSTPLPPTTVGPALAGEVATHEK